MAQHPKRVPWQLSRRNLLIGGLAASVIAPRVARATSSTRPKNLIVCLAKGGWDTSFSFDPKVGNPYVEGPEVDRTENPADVEELRTYHENQQVLCNDLKRPAVSEFFQKWGHRAAVVNGMWTGSIVHQPCRIRLLTGTASSLKPDFSTIFGHVMGQAEPIGSIDFSGLGYAGHLAASTGTVGARSQLRALLDPDSAFRAPSWADYALPRVGLNSTEEGRIQALLAERAQAYAEVRGQGTHNTARVQDMLISLDRRQRLQEKGLDIAANLPLGEQPSFLLQSQLAVDLLEKGLCRAVTLQHFESWDTHKSNVLQHERYQDFFTTIVRMLDDLDGRGLLDSTLVCVMSEMSRTPKRNVGLGKDHWGHTSQILVGGGVRGGRTFGGTDDLAEAMHIDLASGEVVGGAQDSGEGALLKYDNMAAGVLSMLDVDPEPWFPSITPFTGACANA
ncbi:MAG: DUF1501 domain-containing protein [Rhodobacterales bacterium]|nr:DUF1501 domain-containing protein [Rhodobacterales bacterium]